MGHEKIHFCDDRIGIYLPDLSKQLHPCTNFTILFQAKTGRKAALKYFNMIKKAYNNSNR